MRTETAGKETWGSKKQAMNARQSIKSKTYANPVTSPSKPKSLPKTSMSMPPTPPSISMLLILSVALNRRMLSRAVVMIKLLLPVSYPAIAWFWTCGEECII